MVEFSMGLGVLGLLLFADRRLGGQGKPRGVLTAIFLLSYFTCRFLVEFLKERHGHVDNLLLSRGQLLSIPGIAAGAVLLICCLGGRSERGSPASKDFKREGAKNASANRQKSEASKSGGAGGRKSASPGSEAPKSESPGGQNGEGRKSERQAEALASSSKQAKSANPQGRKKRR
jgi:hypothetical protein